MPRQLEAGPATIFSARRSAWRAWPLRAAAFC